MSRDARNSLIAWGSVLAMAALFWLGARYLPVPPEISPWVGRIAFALIAINLAWDAIRWVRAARREKADG